MIFPAEHPLESACTELQALHVALNSPVLHQDPLPVGPAAAAVALHVGVPGVSVALRSVRTGQVAFFTTDANADLAPGMAVDAGLSFAEALGFVFDEDEVGPDGAGGEAAARLWCELIGEDHPAAKPASSPSLSGPPGEPASRPVLHLDEEGDAATVQEILEAAASPPLDPRTILSKFRWPAGPTADAPEVERKTA